MPVEAAEAVDQMREGGPERERTDEDAERSPAASPKPGRHQLQCGRIDAGEEEPGRETERDGRRGAVCREEQGVRSGGADRAHEHDDVRGDHVGEVEERGDERSDDEPELDGDREPGRRAT